MKNIPFTTRRRTMKDYMDDPYRLNNPIIINFFSGTCRPATRKEIKKYIENMMMAESLG